MKDEFRVSVKAVVVDGQGKVLFVNGGKGSGNLPGGDVKAGELPLQVLIRELQEELGILMASIDQRPLIIRDETVSSEMPRLGIWYYTELQQDPKPANEITTYKYLSLKEIYQLDEDKGDYYTNLAADLMQVLEQEKEKE
jgi:8-oxo-dGTP pyrophosphatase MutT (NUDIX family)